MPLEVFVQCQRIRCECYISVTESVPEQIAREKVEREQLKQQKEQIVDGALISSGEAIAEEGKSEE